MSTERRSLAHLGVRFVAASNVREERLFVRPSGFLPGCLQGDGSIGSVDETTPVDPPSWAPYSRSKAEAEKLVLQANSPPEFESRAVSYLDALSSTRASVQRLLDVCVPSRFAWRLACGGLICACCKSARIRALSNH